MIRKELYYISLYNLYFNHLFIYFYTVANLGTFWPFSIKCPFGHPFFCPFCHFPRFSVSVHAYPFRYLRPIEKRFLKNASRSIPKMGMLRDPAQTATCTLFRDYLHRLRGYWHPMRVNPHTGMYLVKYVPRFKFTWLELRPNPAGPSHSLTY